MTESPGCASCGFPIPAHRPGEIAACPLCHTANQVAQLPLAPVPAGLIWGIIGLGVGFILGKARLEINR